MPRTRYISHHAIERFRERVTALNHSQWVAGDLAKIIDGLVADSIKAGKVRAILDRATPAKLVNLSDNVGEAMFAVVKKNDRASSAFSEAVITIMNGDMVAQYFRDNTWRDAGGMAQKLATMPALPTQQAVAAAKARKPPMPTKAPVRPTVRPIDTLVSYIEGDRIVYKQVPRAELKKRLLELVNTQGIETSTIRAWREIPIQTRIEIDIDLDS